MKKELIEELLEEKKVETHWHWHFPPREEPRRDASVRVSFDVKFTKEGKVLSVNRKCNLPCPCNECPFRKVCESIQERIHL